MKLIDAVEILEHLVRGDNSLKSAAASATLAGEFMISADITQTRATLLQQIHNILIKEDGILEMISPEVLKVYMENFKKKSIPDENKIVNTRQNKVS